MSVKQISNPSIHDFVILDKVNQINIDSFCLVKVTPKSISELKNYNKKLE